MTIDVLYLSILIIQVTFFVAFSIPNCCSNWANRSNWKELTAIFVAWPHCRVYKTPTWRCYNRRLCYNYWLSVQWSSRKRRYKVKKVRLNRRQGQKNFLERKKCAQSQVKRNENLIFFNKPTRYKEKNAICWPNLWRLQRTMSGVSGIGPHTVSWPTNINFKHASILVSATTEQRQS